MTFDKDEMQSVMQNLVVIRIKKRIDKFKELVGEEPSDEELSRICENETSVVCDAIDKLLRMD